MSTAKQQHHATSDRISNLPLNVTQQILECLPLQQAARTSVLLKYWRNKWASTSKLILDESFAKCICEKKTKPSDKLLAYNKAVTDILLSHVGPIGKFVLYIPSWIPKKTDFSSWLRFVYDNGVNDITTNDDRSLYRNVPTCLFSFVRLTHLTLLNCNFGSLSPTFRGFPCLISLEIDITYTYYSRGDALTNLISKCPLPERLHLSFYISSGNMTIRAPKLLEFILRAQKVIDVSLVATRAIEFDLQVFNFSDFTSPKMFPKFLTRLQALELIDIALNYDSNISLVLCLLLSSPNLERLRIKAANDEAESDGQLSQFDDTYIFQHLKIIHLVGITGLSNELKLIRFLLACSPVLEKITIELSTKIGGAEEQVNFFKELNQYRRASTNVEMIFKT
ncbi:F-box/FBD/LRR-repeat protein At1g13570-like [Chenopodium quinoa]|uniref:F-box/FBD/LRR-repeat protein At1g13570-like n=1 Tax=Chenopodium quinoa TaxID=63459 RepID=UPI000B77D61B|nr:F-box/FBD/LRR-repeat protein At1g13570-like [Chenopodium quinoa]